MSNRIVVSQVLKEIANDFDQRGNHELADIVTEDLLKFASTNENIREAFFKKLFKGLGGKNFWGNIGQAIQSGSKGYFKAQLNYNKYLQQIRMQNQTIDSLNKLKLQIQNDPSMGEQFKTRLYQEIDVKVGKRQKGRQIGLAEELPGAVGVASPKNPSPPTINNTNPTVTPQS